MAVHGRITRADHFRSDSGQTFTQLPRIKQFIGILAAKFCLQRGQAFLTLGHFFVGET